MIPERLTPMARLEVVLEAADVPALETLFRAEGVTGWTSLPGLSGVGHHGRHDGRLLFNETSGQTMVVTVVPGEHLDALVSGVEEMLADRAGVMFVSQVHVSRAAYFRS